MGVVLALALGAAAGLNPYVTAAIAAVVAMDGRYFQPNPGLGFVATPAFLIVALALLPVDLFADKFRRSGGLMDRVSWLVRPLTGAALGGAAM
ncbi:MAG: DUF4126 family protein, partial [Actinobacteria bacterium]|nr:DUF4126 family protein [Actinomycetota bacterium]